MLNLLANNNQNRKRSRKMSLFGKLDIEIISEDELLVNKKTFKRNQEFATQILMLKNYYDAFVAILESQQFLSSQEQLNIFSNPVKEVWNFMQSLDVSVYNSQNTNRITQLIQQMQRIIKENAHLLVFIPSYSEVLMAFNEFTKNSERLKESLIKNTYENYYKHFDDLSDIYKSKFRFNLVALFLILSLWVFIGCIIIGEESLIKSSSSGIEINHILIAISAVFGFLLINAIKIYKSNHHLYSLYKHISASIQFYMNNLQLSILKNEMTQFTQDLSKLVFNINTGLVKEEPPQSMNPIELIRAINSRTNQ